MQNNKQALWITLVGAGLAFLATWVGESKDYISENTAFWLNSGIGFLGSLSAAYNLYKISKKSA